MDATDIFPSTKLPVDHWLGALLSSCNTSVRGNIFISKVPYYLCSHHVKRYRPFCAVHRSYFQNCHICASSISFAPKQCPVRANGNWSQRHLYYLCGISQNISNRMVQACDFSWWWSDSTFSKNSIRWLYPALRPMQHTSFKNDAFPLFLSSSLPLLLLLSSPPPLRICPAFLTSVYVFPPLVLLSC